MRFFSKQPGEKSGTFWVSLDIQNSNNTFESSPFNLSQSLYDNTKANQDKTAKH